MIISDWSQIKWNTVYGIVQIAWKNMYTGS